ncbi:unnamed protein product [Eruca vesicaria subsp. sativa]|uniref:Uncharacterized protein n=1 Tax=Eruca vesicaria subsp. sativa TaxID=29727 RepID=A0ABC8L890_ERUVS|nr:unnamed protein product [Eruca vesicaria subsp. sativa]
MKLKDQGKYNEQKLLNLEKTVYELSKKKSSAKQMVCLLVVIGLALLLLRGNSCKSFKGECTFGVSAMKLLDLSRLKYRSV